MGNNTVGNTGSATSTDSPQYQDMLQAESQALGEVQEQTANQTWFTAAMDDEKAALSAAKAASTG